MASTIAKWTGAAAGIEWLAGKARKLAELAKKALQFYANNAARPFQTMQQNNMGW